MAWKERDGEIRAGLSCKQRRSPGIVSVLKLQ